MDQLIVGYLFANKNCPLPDMGSLVIENNIAENDFVNKKIFSPYPTIKFEARHLASDDLINFISTKNRITLKEAEDQLKNYCNQIQSKLETDASFLIEHVGRFFVDADGNLMFEEEKLPAYYFPAIVAERVVHPQAEHAVLVGDKESTNTEMAYFLNEEEEEKKNKWCIWAILLFCIAVVIILTYFNSAAHKGMFGNNMSIF